MEEIILKIMKTFFEFELNFQGQFNIKHIETNIWLSAIIQKPRNCIFARNLELEFYSHISNVRI